MRDVIVDSPPTSYLVVIRKSKCHGKTSIKIRLKLPLEFASAGTPRIELYPFCYELDLITQHSLIPTPPQLQN
jgi:hypothetical protein